MLRSSPSHEVGNEVGNVYAVTIPEPGGPEVLTWAEVPDPAPGPGEVLIDVAASAVNRADIAQREGLYPPPAGAPDWPGLECSGVIAAIGPGVAGWAVGDGVCALLSGGGYATRVAVPAAQLLPVPSGTDVVSAAALPEVVCTVWSNVVMAAGLGSGDVFLVHGGASGIGTMAIQVGVALGARVVVTAGSQRKLDACGELGASVLVNYRSDDFVDAVGMATDGRGADVILDIIGAKYLAQNVTALARGGRLVVVGVQAGRRAELDLWELIGKRGHITGSLLRSRPPAEKASIVTAVREHAWPLVESGQLRPVIDRVLPMPDAAEAHAVVERSDHLGKVLLST